MEPRTRSRILRVAIALFVGLVEPVLEVAWKCRAGFETTEACVWGKSYLPLSRALGLIIVAPVTFGLLTLIGYLWRRWRSRPRS